jgi:hypothetical protein
LIKRRIALIDQIDHRPASQNWSNLGFIILILVVLGCSCPNLSDLARKTAETPAKATPPPPASTPETIKGEYVVTMAKYNQIRKGMPRVDVEEILGGKGTEISNSTGGGVRFTVHKWEGEKFRSIILTFRNDKVLEKRQVGLK